MPRLTVRRMLVISGVATLAAMGVSAAAVASSMLAKTLAPHSEAYEQAKEIAILETGSSQD